MNFFKILCQFVVGLLLTIVSYMVYTAYKLGEFVPIVPLNAESCVKINNEFGDFGSCEDIVSIKDGTLFGSYDPNRLHFMILGQYSSISHSQRIKESTQLKNGGIVIIPPNLKYSDILNSKNKNNKNENINLPYHAKILNYPNNLDFHPHGIYTVELNKRNWLFVVNHRYNGEYIDIFEIMLDKTKNRKYYLYYWDSIIGNQQSLFVSNINSITVLSDEFTNNNNKIGFYATNWLVNPLGTMDHFAEFWGQTSLGSVIYCETDKTLFFQEKKEHKWKCDKVIENLIQPNGIQLSSDEKELYLIHHGFDIYSRNIKTNEIDVNNVKKISSLPCDNVRINNNNEIIVAHLPKPLHFVWYMNGIETSNNVPSKLMKYNKSTQKLETIFESNGDIISGATGGIISNDRLFIASFRDDLVMCDWTNK